jgi:hypothetical protein
MPITQQRRHQIFDQPSCSGLDLDGHRQRNRLPRTCCEFCHDLVPLLLALVFQQLHIYEVRAARFRTVSEHQGFVVRLNTVTYRV